ncbi:unnamed protein product [Protopolystoma xenopodis]|uniref:C2H2-type domain-containing protein n=1 Tax=Protopolystoma xenopodis TaxID=117903 RepID=A0A448X577_9PLAT|nr:unnamed protein product [Protopolystoma xenopodis]
MSVEYLIFHFSYFQVHSFTERIGTGSSRHKLDSDDLSSRSLGSPSNQEICIKQNYPVTRLTTAGTRLPEKRVRVRGTSLTSPAGIDAENKGPSKSMTKNKDETSGDNSCSKNDSIAATDAFQSPERVSSIRSDKQVGGCKKSGACRIANKPYEGGIRGEGVNTRQAGDDGRLSDHTGAANAPGSNPRRHRCSICHIGFRMSGHLAKHYRSKAHLTMLLQSGRIPAALAEQVRASSLPVHQLVDQNTGELLAFIDHEEAAK